MWLPEPSSLGAGNDDALFLLATWRELFDPFTADTYQPRLHNTATLVDELSLVARRACDASIWIKHAHGVRDELAVVAHEEKDLFSEMPEYLWQTERIQSATAPREIAVLCDLLIRKREQYEQSLEASFDKASQSILQHKDRTYTALRRLATLAIWSAQENDDVLANLPAETATAKDIFAALRASTHASSARYECIFIVSGETRRVQQIVRKVGFQLVAESDMLDEQVELLKRKHDQANFVQNELDARSFRDAVETARQQLGVGVDLFNLYSNSQALRVADEVLVRKEGAATFTVFDQSEQAFRRLHPRTKAPKDTIETLNLISGNHLEDRVLSALELHSLALSSSEPRVRLVNLWSALECLAGCRHHESVIQRVLELVTPLLVWRRVDKIVRYAAISTQQFGKLKNDDDYGEGFPRSSAEFVHPWDMMTTLCREGTHPHMRGLLRFSKDHPLLVYRLFRLCEELHSPTRLCKALVSSENRLRWQLTRIYRARNLLVHDGEQVQNLRFLLDNLQYYSSVVIQRIIHGMKLQPKWGVHEASTYWNAKSQYVIESLRKSPHQLRVSDFFPLQQHGNAPQLWA